MAWIQVDQALPTHRKTLILADTLDISPTHAVGLMVTLWLWSLDNAPDGLLDDIPPRTLARILQWDGDGDELMKAMRSAGFLDENEIHDWQEYAGRLLDQRAAAKERMRKHRAASSQQNKQKEHDADSLCEPRANVTRTEPERCAPVHGRVHYTTQQETKEEKSTVPSVSSSDDDTEAPADQEEMFLRFWEIYPKKAGKKAALASWKRLRPDASLFAQIIETVSKAKKSEQWQREGGRYVPNPATWINQGRWDDEIEEVDTNGTGANQQHTGQDSGSFALSGFKTIDDEE